MNLEYTGEEKITAGPDKVWAFVTDPDKVAHCMLAARPFIATFAAVNNAAALARLARSVRLRN